MNYDNWKLETPEHKDCPECDGAGHFLISNCCGAEAEPDMMICFACKDHCDFSECGECDGTGTV